MLFFKMLLKRELIFKNISEVGKFKFNIKRSGGGLTIKLCWAEAWTGDPEDFTEAFSDAAA